eukprot:1440117-Pyramimonas_sp.AAC.1
MEYRAKVVPDLLPRELNLKQTRCETMFARKRSSRRIRKPFPFKRNAVGYIGSYLTSDMCSYTPLGAKTTHMMLQHIGGSGGLPTVRRSFS